MKCKNCNYPIDKKYCSNCGQKDVKDLTLKTILRDISDNIFNLDSRLLLTIKCLLLKPGFLTTEYWAGRRKRYFSPFRLLIVTSFIFYFMVPYIVEIENTEPKKIIVETEKDGYQSALMNIMPFILKYLSLAFTPIAALVLGWLFKSIKKSYLEHAVVFLHFTSFDFCLQTFTSFFELYLPQFNAKMELLFVGATVMYVFLMLKHIYSEPLLITFTKSIVLSFTLVLFFFLIVMTHFLLTMVY